MVIFLYVVAGGVRLRIHQQRFDSASEGAFGERIKRQLIISKKISKLSNIEQLSISRR